MATVSSAVGSVAEAVASLPDVGLAQLLLASLQSAGSDPLTALVERDYSTAPGEKGGVEATVTVYTIDDTGLSLAYQWNSRGTVVAFLPPARYLPADVTVGATWTQQGTTNAKAAYSVTGRVLSIDGECALVERTFTQEGADGSPQRTTTRDTWCRGRGNTSTLDLTAGQEYVVAEPNGAAPLPRVPPEQKVTIDPVTQNIVARLGEGPDAALRWQQHPGGSIVSLTQSGGLIIATTTLRQKVAFDADGQLRSISASTEVDGHG